VGVLILVVVAGTAILCIAIAWLQWTKTHLTVGGATWRRSAGFISILGSSSKLLLFVLFELSTAGSGTLNLRRKEYPLWAAIDFCLLGLVIISALVGRGRYRFSAFGSAVAMTIVWVLLGTAM